MNASTSVTDMSIERWDNPVPMSCDFEQRDRHASWHIWPCTTDAQFIRLAEDGETVTAFRCWRHRYD